jgi:AraC family transcriptional regulator
MSGVIAKTIDVKNLQARNLAFIGHVGPYFGDERLFDRLFGTVMSWARPRGLFQLTQTELITVYHDNPEITEQKDLRISVGLTVPKNTPCTGEIQLMEIPAGQYVCADFEINASQYNEAWDLLRYNWMFKSGWQPGDGPDYECYLNDPQQHPQRKHVIEIRMSVKPLLTDE